MKRLIFLLEEPSAKEMLKAILPKILPDHVYPEFKIFDGKQDLEKGITRTLKAWRIPNCAFVVIRDQDSGNCQIIKQNLVDLCKQAERYDVLVRIACHELESFYLGDLIAVEKGLNLSGLAKKQNNKKYRDPDRITSPSQELTRLTSGLYQKIAGSRAIAPHIHIENNKSHSFKILLAGICKLAGE
ncbi:DUF4276 [Desulfonema limicola]|uniref:DUF4276 n=1 Tax=Desulfonema limicola TaxID=45656 RepID=A0A975GJP1_9BACT|nr:DUF4276 family protein [Desulfonema limicola]QTA83697.1 DUF4276 [Desulfonema limicola]